MIITQIENKAFSNPDKTFGQFVVIEPQLNSKDKRPEKESQLIETKTTEQVEQETLQAVAQKLMSDGVFVSISFGNLNSERKFGADKKVENTGYLYSFGDTVEVDDRGSYKVFYQIVEQSSKESKPKELAIKHIVIDSQSQFKGLDEISKLLRTIREDDYQQSQPAKKRTIFLQAGDEQQAEYATQFILLNMAVDQFEKMPVLFTNDYEKAIARNLKMLEGVFVGSRQHQDLVTQTIISNLKAFEFDNVTQLLTKIIDSSKELEKDQEATATKAITMIQNLFKLNNWQAKLECGQRIANLAEEEEFLVLNFPDLTISTNRESLFCRATFAQDGKELTIDGDFDDLPLDAQGIVIKKLCERAAQIAEQKMTELAKSQTLKISQNALFDEHAEDSPRVHYDHAIEGAPANSLLALAGTGQESGSETAAQASLFQKINRIIDGAKTLRGLASQLFDECFKTNEDQANPNITDRGKIIFENRNSQKIVAIRNANSRDLQEFNIAQIDEATIKNTIRNILELGLNFSKESCDLLLSDYFNELALGDLTKSSPPALESNSQTASTRTRRSLPVPPASAATTNKEGVAAATSGGNFLAIEGGSSPKEMSPATTLGTARRKLPAPPSPKVLTKSHVESDGAAPLKKEEPNSRST